MKTNRSNKVLNLCVILFVTILISSFSSGEQNESALCSKSCKSSINGSYIEEFCSKQSLQLKQRCCVNATSSRIVGIDLCSCDLTTVTGLFEHLPELQVILLEDNPISNVTSSDFHGLLDLQYLSLPPDLVCPGGWDAWETFNTTTNKTVCLEEVNFCRMYNVSCPANSECDNTGPGMTECLCSPGYHGYKCLRQGTFPTLVFSSGMIGSTLVIAGFLWVTQRRNVKKTV